MISGKIQRAAGKSAIQSTDTDMITYTHFSLQAGIICKIAVAGDPLPAVSGIKGMKDSENSLITPAAGSYPHKLIGRRKRRVLKLKQLNIQIGDDQHEWLRQRLLERESAKAGCGSSTKAEGGGTREKAMFVSQKWRADY